MANRIAVFAAGLVGAAGVSFAASNMDFSSKKETLSAKFSYVGYEPTTDKAIVQYTNEDSARLIPAVDLLKLEENPQLIMARKSAGKV